MTFYDLLMKHTIIINEYTAGLKSGSRNGPLPLSRLAPGESAVIEQVTTDTDAQMKLMELGIAPGERVTYVRSTPFGGPLVLEVLDHRLAIRMDEAERILVDSNTINKSPVTG